MTGLANIALAVVTVEKLFDLEDDEEEDVAERKIRPRRLLLFSNRLKLLLLREELCTYCYVFERELSYGALLVVPLS